VTAVVSDVADLQAAIAACKPGRRLLPVAGGTKPPLSSTQRDNIELLDVSALTGIIEYEPGELTLTARAATPTAEIADLLSGHDQYLPFDPPLVRAGATIGGVVATGASGPNALRHGAVRDFVIGVSLVDGTGCAASAGGRVVKNAAGFDLPKLMVGSIGRLGVMTQLSLKVFPRPRATASIEFAFDDAASAIAAVRSLVASPREIDAADVLPRGHALVRLAGDPDVLPARLTRLEASVTDGNVIARYEGPGESELWTAVSELQWMPGDHVVVCVPVSAKVAQVVEDVVLAAGGAVRFSLAVNVAWVAWPSDTPLATLDAALTRAELRGVVLRGDAPKPVLGAHLRNSFGDRVRRAFDPHDRFLGL
jgi:glycolate oxidase FAD binding subunit